MNKTQKQQPNEPTISSDQVNQSTNNKKGTFNFCPNCGQKATGANFCPNCGQKLV
nr:zinc ribbon domain-containing protein [Oceanobacillus piezotolerans]